MPAGVGEVAQEIKGRIEEFKPFIPLIQGLRNPGMRSRHWEQLSDDLGFPIRPKANLTFSKCLEMKLNDHIQTIAKVAEVAGKEYSIEQVRPSKHFPIYRQYNNENEHKHSGTACMNTVIQHA